MKGATIPVFVGLLLAGCGHSGTPAAAYSHAGDRWKAVTFGLFGNPCTRPSKDLPNAEESVPSRDCYRFDPPARMSGIWINGFESSDFLPDGSTLSDSRTYPSGISLEEDKWGGTLLKRREDNFGKAYAITFIGSMSSYSGHFGHLGGSARLVLVDRLISIREVPKPKFGEIIRTAAPTNASK
ncbi:MAG: hypothetical protein ACTHJR_06940 [Sphingomonas sp.]|uniref:hypothetical protein n=1 Tax=Sphingomonas sp. TaxID=28214 RepID=UPI003F7EE522